MQSDLTVDSLAQEIRRVDGNHSLGAGALAEALIPFLTAALSDKQAVEVQVGWAYNDKRWDEDRWHPCGMDSKPRPAEGRKIEPIYLRSALVDVPAVEPVSNDLIGYVLRYGGMCRDCADMDGICQSGQPCDTEQRRAVIKHTIAALAYGIKHGFIANPFASPPLSREGEDSAGAFARIVAARKAHVEATETYNTRLSLVNSERAKGNWSMRVDDEARAMWDAQSAFIKAAQDETDAAIAATRSGSATTASGDQP